MRRDLSEGEEPQVPDSPEKETGVHLGLSSPVGSLGSSRSRIPRTVGVFMRTRLNLGWVGAT